MEKLPLKFEVAAETTPGLSNPWECCASNFSPIKIAVPVDFGGPGNTYSPEELFGLSILNCLFSVFKIVADKNKLNFSCIKGKLISTLDKTHEDSKIAITSVDIYIEVTGAQDKEKTKNVLTEAFQRCPVSNSIKSAKTFHINVI